MHCFPVQLKSPNEQTRAEAALAIANMCATEMEGDDAPNTQALVNGGVVRMLLAQCAGESTVAYYAFLALRYVSHRSGI